MPIPCVPDSILCLVSMLQYYFHLVPHLSSGLIPLFLYQSGLQFHILTYPLVLCLLQQKLSILGYKPSNYSGHSFCHGGASWWCFFVFPTSSSGSKVIGTLMPTFDTLANLSLNVSELQLLSVLPYNASSDPT